MLLLVLSLLSFLVLLLLSLLSLLRLALGPPPRSSLIPEEGSPRAVVLTRSATAGLMSLAEFFAIHSCTPESLGYTMRFDENGMFGVDVAAGPAAGLGDSQAELDILSNLNSNPTLEHDLGALMEDDWPDFDISNLPDGPATPVYEPTEAPGVVDLTLESQALPGSAEDVGASALGPSSIVEAWQRSLDDAPVALDLDCLSDAVCSADADSAGSEVGRSAVAASDVEGDDAVSDVPDVRRGQDRARDSNSN